MVLTDPPVPCIRTAILTAVSTRPAAAAGTVAALLRATHPLPSAAVTAFAVAASAAAGRSTAGCVLVAGAVATGQVSIGLSNDLLDRHRDEQAARPDKPLATGEVSPRLATVACGVALACCLPLSLASGWRAGAAHLVAVAGGWAYNLGLKRTLLSALPYAVSFGLLTAFVTLGLPGNPWPRPWALTAGALLGVGAHFLNVVPDVDDDLAGGVRGLPQRLGASRSAVVGALLLSMASVSAALGPGLPAPGWAWAGLAVAVVLSASAAVLGRRRTTGRAPFGLAVATAAVAVAMVVARGSDLT